MFLLFGVPTVHLQRTFMLLSFRFAPLREWERQKENLIAFMEEANRLLLLVHACLCQRRPLGSASTFMSPSQCQERPLCFFTTFSFCCNTLMSKEANSFSYFSVAHQGSKRGGLPPRQPTCSWGGHIGRLFALFNLLGQGIHQLAISIGSWTQNKRCLQKVWKDNGSGRQLSNRNTTSSSQVIMTFSRGKCK